MEVKIKNNEEMIDATIEVIDGVMVVSPVKMSFPRLNEPVWVIAGGINAQNYFAPGRTMYSKAIEQAYKLGRVFKTEIECQEFCDKLNEAINQVKP